MGVIRGWRGKGVGRHLLDHLITMATVAGIPALSLSVEPDNYAYRLYQRVGFQKVKDFDGSVVLKLELPLAGSKTSEFVSSVWSIRDAGSSQL